MHRRAALFILLAGVLTLAGALTLVPRAPGLPEVPGDPTPPEVTIHIVGTLGLQGWYTSNVTASWTVTDPESIILSTTGCDTRTLTADTAGIRLSCTAISDGGETTVAKTFTIDKTAPVATATPSRAADSNGWYNHALSVGFSGSDAMSGLDSCSSDASYGGPDSGSASVSGTCRDVAGNSATASLPVRYDETAPQASPSARSSDRNGWYNHAVTVSYQGSDATSGIDRCSQMTYSGPDDPSVALAGTCIDNAGNQSGSSVFTMRYDETGPQASATASRAPDVNAWYNHQLTVSFSGNDDTSGLDVCDAPEAYSGPDSANAIVTGTCRDMAGNTVSRSLQLSYDATAPQVTATPSRQPNPRGWYKALVSVAFTGTDAMSGVGSCAAPRDYTGPDSASASVSGNCVDNAGNVGNKSFGLKYDATAPLTTATPGRQPNANGWYNAQLSVSFAGTDATAGIESCDAPASYSGPDTLSTTVTGACRDNAGNSAPDSFTLRYDATDPTVTAAAARPPNSFGWYRTSIDINFSGGDATSGIDACDAARTYSGPDNATASVSGDCRDRAGNVGTDSLPLKYDATAPVTAATPDRPPNAHGWYRAAVTVTYAGTDATAGIDSCDAARTYSGPDTQSATLSGSCRDKAGNASSALRAVSYDATAPVATATPSRQPNANNWFNAPLTAHYTATDGMSGFDRCDADDSYSGPDSANASVSGTCLDNAGNSGSATYGLRYDATAPQATATPDRQPNAHGWYRAPVTVSFAGTDAMSGLDSCPGNSTYSGPDNGAAAVNGTCFDRAGNGGLASLPLRYDATAPVTTATPDRQPNANGWYRAAVTVSFAGTDATAGIDSCDPARSYSGPDTQSTTMTGACSDRAGNQSSASRTLKYDATAPSTTATPDRQPNVHGWYRAPVTVSYAGTDAMSGMDPCEAPESYSGPDNGSASVTGTCPDKAGNIGAASFALRYDATAPATTATADRPPNANGWYRAAMTVTYAGTDATAGIDTCDAPGRYTGPDIQSTTLTGACRDNAGNASSASRTLKYDATAPSATATPDRQPNANGWYRAPVTVTFAATDPMSGLDSCAAPQSYAGPDTVSTAVSGTCFDRAGNGGLASYAVSYDQTAPVTSPAPSRQADHATWYSAPLDIGFRAADATSGTDSCTPTQPYSGPDTASASRSGSCSDRAGNSSSTSFAFKYDATPPDVTNAVPRRAPDRAGWYNHAVEVDAQGRDVTSGLAGPCTSVTYSGPDGNNVPISGQCVDVAGNVGFRWFSIDYDGTGPQVAATANRGPDVNGWYNHALEVDFTGTDSVSGLESCAPPENYSGPDSGLAVVGGICLDKAGNAGVASYALQYDATAPQVTGASPARVPDSNAWYNHPLVVTFQGTDATSAIEACTKASYAGPDAAATSVSGFCRDRAGNRSSDSSFALRYDSTAPSLTGVTAKARDRKAVLNWTVSPDTTVVEIERAGKLVYSGHDESFTNGGLKNGVRYAYTVRAYDEAHNAATATTVVTPTAPLVSPPAGAVVTAPPRLAWIRDPKATHYNVQVWRKGRIFSSWPKGTSIRLKRSWTYDGRRYRMAPGKYRWYVWPGYGKLTSKKFGPLLGSSTFVVRAR